MGEGLSAETCLNCQGTGKVHRKVWETPKRVFHEDGRPVHPAIQASIPAQRTIAVFTCEGCKGTGVLP